MARILVIDDEAVIRDALRKMLERAGHEVEVALDGQEGVERYRQNPPDLLITDLFMPQKDGLEAIGELRHEFPDAKIIAMTSEGSKRNYDFLQVAGAVGAGHTLAKPFTMAQLQKAVEDILNA